ncbi:hypothetical protein K9L27_00025 [Candidatus Gracilibacteria bacterium]|nr:hypothetical protein [Candidatus Gracilibacteria bacterium]
MRNLLLSFFCGYLVVGGSVMAQTAPVMSNTERLYLQDKHYDPVMKNNILKDQVDQFTNGTEESLVKIFRKNQSGIIEIFNYVIGAIAILWLAVLGSKFVFSQGEEDKITNYKKEFGWIILGLATVAIGEYVAFEVLSPTQDILGRNNSSVIALSNKIDQIVLFFEIFVGGIMLMSMMMSGYNLITGSEEDEKIEQEKNIFQSFFIGSFLILTAEIFSRVFGGAKATGDTNNPIDYLTHPGEMVDQGVSEIVGLINFALTFVGGAVLVMLILASLYYIISFGNEDQMGRAKRIIIACVIGVIVVVSSYTIIRFMIA